MMRPASFAVLLTLAVAPSASAQALESFGLKLGGTESTIETEILSEDPRARRGFNWMLFAEWCAPSPFRLVTEAGVLERGYSRMSGSAPAELTQEPPVHRLDRRMQYVSVAALAKLPVVDAGPLAAYAMAGPRMNALIGRRGDDSGRTTSGYDYSPVTWEATAGIGVEILRGPPLMAEARYSAGLNNAFSGPGWGMPAYHRAVDVMVGFKF